MSYTEQEYADLIRKFPGLSPKIKADCHSHSRKVAELESNTSHAPLAEKELQGALQKRYLVRITSVRKYMLDTDNICSKYITDLLRYSNIIASDDFEQTTIQTTERKATQGEEEHTLIEIDIYDACLQNRTL